jgi:D-3-phosphoglycerate dehydrogenase
MPFNLLITARSFGFASSRALEALHTIPGLAVDKPEHTAAFDEAQMCDLIPGRDAVIVGTDRITAKVIAAADRLKVVAKHGVGVDNIDIAAATAAGIVVTNMPGMNDLAVADMAFGLLIALSRGIALVHHRVKNRDWGKLLAHDVSGKTLGVIGTGRIGQAMIRRALAFDMTVIAYDVEQNHGAAEALGFTYVPFEELLARADFISLHVPLTPGTEGLIGAAELACMKPTAYLINTSRGEIVDEVALLKALKEGALAGAAFDVYSKSLPSREDVYRLDNLIVTPHIAAYTYETLESMDMALVQAFEQIVRGELPANVNVLNPEVRGLRLARP